MATVTKKGARTARQFGGMPCGNAWSGVYRFATNASGVMTDSDQTTAVAQADVVRLGVLPAGLQLHDALMLVSDAFTALTTCKVGFAYVDGVDSTAVPQDDDYFGAAITTHTLGRYAAANTGVTPVVLPKDAYLILTVAGANHAAAGIMDVIVRGIHTGQP